MKLKVLIMLLVIPFIFSGCANKEHIKPHFYVFATNSEETKEENLSIYDLDIDSKKATKIASVEDFSQQPSMVYCKDDNTIYYAQRIETETSRGVQLYSVNVDTKETHQLTDNLWAINCIIPTKNDIYLLAVTTEDRHLKPMLYHKDTKELEILSKDTDLNFTQIDYDVITNNLYASGTLMEKSEKTLNEYNKDLTQNPSKQGVMTDYYIYDFTNDYKNPKQLLKTDKAEIIGLCSIPGEEKINYRSDDGLIKSDYIYNLKTNKITESFLYPFKMKSVEQYVFLNENEVVLIGEVQNNSTEYIRGVYLYNIKTEESKLLFSLDNEEIFKIQITTD